jgi:hypothetical protein
MQNPPRTPAYFVPMRRNSNILLGAMAAATAAMHLICINQYGFFRDELYFLACGEHLDWGYVDQPPFVAVIAWIARHLGTSLLAVRILPVLAAAALVALTGAMARRLGGRLFAQFLACLTALIAPIYIALGHFLSMNIFEPLFWMGMAYVAIVIFQGGSEKLWLVFGALAGLGLENKHTTLFFGSAFVLAMLLTRERRHFARPWIWLGGIVAAIVFAPNALWEVRHHFPTIELLQNIAHSHKNAPVSLGSFVSGQLLLVHPINAIVWIAGLVWLFRRAQYRVLAWAWLICFAEFVVMKGKIYYLAPAYPMLLAAGSVAIESWTAARARAWRVAAAAIVLVAGAAIAPLTLPILPVPTYIAYQKALHFEPPQTENHRFGPLPQQYADMFGWPEMVATVARVYDSLPAGDRARCMIFGQNYGEAGAIDWFGPRYGLPKAVSAHQNYFYWGPRNYDGSVAIVLNDDRETLSTIFNSVELAAHFEHPYSMPYEHFDIWICRDPKVNFQELYPKIKKWI